MNNCDSYYQTNEIKTEKMELYTSEHCIPSTIPVNIS